MTHVWFPIIVPRHGEAIGEDIEMLGVRLCVRHKACWRINFHALIYTIFDPVMHTTIALDEFKDE